ncbi:patr class I histocompatibility antigen, alpha chain G [Pogona vitticeps]
MLRFSFHQRRSEFHTCQWLFGCKLSQDGLKAGVNKFSYDGKEVLSFKKDYLTWTGYDPVGQEYKRERESEPGHTQSSKHSLEEKCINMGHQLLKTDKKERPRRDCPVDHPFWDQKDRNHQKELLQD